MKHATGTFTAEDGTKLFTQQWLPDDDPKAVIFLTHGYAEHSGRYEHVAAYLVENGYGVYTMDLRGHGQSEGQGPRAHIDSYKTYLDDMDGYYQAVKAAHPGHKFFALGHSMGGILSLAFAVRHQHELEGVVTSGAAFIVAGTPDFLKPVVRVLAAIVPTLGLKPVDSAGVSKDPAVVIAYDSDPLVFRGKTTASAARLFADLPAALRRNLPNLTIPALVMHGSEDSIIDPRSLDEIYGLLGSTDKAKKLYDGLYHEIFNEPEKEMVLTDVVAWLDAHL